LSYLTAKTYTKRMRKKMENKSKYRNHFLGKIKRNALKLPQSQKNHSTIKLEAE
jgi:hypothetical protein